MIAQKVIGPNRLQTPPATGESLKFSQVLAIGEKCIRSKVFFVDAIGEEGINRSGELHPQCSCAERPNPAS